jgi:hypothetical protein
VRTAHAPRPGGASLLALLPVLVGLLACGGEEPTAGGPPAPSWPGPNLLANPGFEAGREGWSFRDQSPHWGDFRIVGRPTHSGLAAAHLRLHHTPALPPRRAKVYGVVQELRPGRFPETLGGFYRVDGWEKSVEGTDLYLQLVVIVWGDPTTAERMAKPGRAVSNYQLRYYLAGLEEPPFRLANARVAFVRRGPPPLGVWQRFEVPLRADFERLWGGVPQEFDHLSVLFEARWDNMPPRSGVRADVYYDDLYVGPGPVGGAGPAR